ncbi:MAG: FAD-binding protein, partial [Nitrospira sp.]|nr:FAD-binding protein [Nitrospira sp.]
FDVCLEDRGVGGPGSMMVYLDLTYKVKEKGREFVEKKLGAILDIYRKFAGEDPIEHPMKIFPGVHYSMGGLWVGFDQTSENRLDWESPNNHMTNIPGLYAAGECEFQYHGANRLGANALLSCIFAGMVSGKAAVKYTSSLATSAGDMAGVGDSELKECKAFQEKVIARDGDENAYRLHKELGELMTKYVTVIRKNPELETTLGKLNDMQERFGRIKLNDKGTRANHEITFTRWLYNMLHLAKVITKGALLRDEFRGAHYKPAFEYTTETGKEMPSFKTTTADNPGDYGAVYQARTGKCLKGETLTAEQVAASKTKADALGEDVIEYFDWFDKVNEKWNRPTIASFEEGEPKIEYGKVREGVMAPVPRKYD